MLKKWRKQHVSQSKFNYLLSSIIALCVFNTAYAGSRPLWTFTPLTETTVSVPSNDTAMVQYRVTNQSNRTRTLMMQPIQGITQLTSGLGICGNPFILTENASCTLSLQVNGSQLTHPIFDGPIVCKQGSTFLCYRPSSRNILHITQVPEAPKLSGVTPTSGSASGGTGVTLSGTGFADTTGVTFGGEAATSVHVVNSTTVTAVTPAHAAGAVDVVITMPSSSAILTNGYTYETTAIGQPAYGGTIACLHGGLNNLIAATADNSTSIEWGGYGTAIGSGAQSNTDGDANTTAIVAALGDNGGTPYAAQLCADYEVDSQGNTPCESGNMCYHDWFLPAGNNNTASGQLNCLYDNKNAIGGFANDYYWSSTESANNPAIFAWVQYFNAGDPLDFDKDFGTRVRCVRAFTP
jgi:hypothetical protein